MKKQKKTRKNTNVKEITGKLFLDIGKLVFGGICIAGLGRGETPHAVHFSIGFFVAIAVFAIGIKLATKEEPNKKNKEEI